MYRCLSLSRPSLDDFIGQVAAVKLSDGAHDAMQEHTIWGTFDILAGGNQPHTHLFKQSVDCYIIRAIPC